MISAYLQRLKLCLIATLVSLLILGTTTVDCSDLTVEILELSVPNYPEAGDDISLTCRFNLGGPSHRLYTVNWWRGKDQFFTFKKSSVNPKNAFFFRGINVMVDNSTEDTVVLENVSEETSGIYKCEVMGESPAFKTATVKKRMSVIIPPERLEITHASRRNPQNVYSTEESIQLNCTAYRVKPSPELQWKINGKTVKRTEMKRYPDLVDDVGRITSTLGLYFLAAQHFINKQANVVCIARVHGHIFTKEERLVNPSAAFSSYSSGGWQFSLMSHMALVSIVLGRRWGIN